MLPSPMTLKYLEAVDREGEKFDLDRWLREMRAERAAAERSTAAVTTGRLSHDRAMPLEVEEIPVIRPCICRPERSTSVTRMSAGNIDLASRDQRPDGSITGRLNSLCDAWERFHESPRRDAVFG